MKNLAIQGTALLSLFFIFWLALAQVNWMELFEVKKSSEKLEEKLGNMLWELYSNQAEELSNDTLTSSLDTLVSSICQANDIEAANIKLHVLDKDEINAFAMPDRHLVIYTGLIRDSKNQEELTGVICHELAHIELNHVMKKLAKELGISMLISVTTGNSGNGLAEIAKHVSSSAFDRNLEKEADLKAVDYLTAANIHPEHLANFLYRMSLNDSDYSNYLSWISTHPDSQERAEYILESIPDRDLKNTPILHESSWNNIKNSLK